MGGLGIEENRAKAIKVALEQIDRHPKGYHARDKQDAMLDALIEKYELKEPRGRKNGKGTGGETELSREKYRSELGNAARNHCLFTRGKTYGLQDILVRGSKIVRPDLLDKIGYGLPVATPSTENDAVEGEAEEDDDEIQLGTKDETARYHLLSEATTVRDEIANTTGESSQEEMAIRNPEQDNIGKELPAPTPSPITPHQMIPVINTKRKASTDLNGTARPSTTPRRHRQVNEVDLNSPDAADDTPTETANRSDKDSSRRNEIGDSISRRDSGPAPMHGPTVKDPTRGLVKLSDTAVVKSIDGVWTEIQNSASKLFSGIHDKAKPRSWSVNASPDVRALYEIIFGNDWSKRANQIRLVDGISLRCVLEFTIAAAIHKDVWKADVPWVTPKKALLSMSEDEEYINRVLRESDPALCFQTIVWQAASAKLQEKEFQKTIVRKHAEKLANDFMFTTGKLWKELGSKRPDEAFWTNITDGVAHVFTKALTLRGQIEAAPDYYEFKWAKSGSAVDPELMEQIHEGEGDQEVAWCVTPLIRKRSTTDGAWRVVCFAKVFSRPRPVGGKG